MYFVTRALNFSKHNFYNQQRVINSTGTVYTP